MPPISLHLPDWFVSGGATMWVLAFMSVIALATLISKILQFARVRPGSARQADRLLDALAKGQQPGKPGKLTSPIDQVVWQCWQNSKLEEAAWQEESLRLARSSLDNLRGGLRILEVISAVAPLLGLLGTILGLISAFTAVASADPAQKADLLSASISVAMNTTAFGLIAAIPMLLAFAFINAMAGKLVDSMEMASVKFVNVFRQVSAQQERKNDGQ